MEAAVEKIHLTLIFAISTLNFLMDVLLHISFQDSGSRRLVKAGSFQDVSCIDPIIVPSSHNMFFEVASELEFVNGDLIRRRV